MPKGLQVIISGSAAAGAGQVHKFLDDGSVILGSGSAARGQDNLNVNVFTAANTGTMHVSGTVSASYFVGDGSQITNIDAGAVVPTNISVADTSDSGTYYLALLSTSGAGDDQVEVDGDLSFNAESNLLTMASASVDTITNSAGQMSLSASSKAHFDIGTWDADIDNLDLDASTSFNMTAASSMNFTTTNSSALNMTVAGAADLDAGGAITIDGSTVAIGGDNDTGAITIDSATAGISLDAAGASNFSTSTGVLTLQGGTGVTIGSTGGTATLNAATQTVDIDCANLDIDTTAGVDLGSTYFDVDTTGAILMNAGAASRLVTSAGALTLSGAGGLTMVATGQTADLDAATLDVDMTSAINLDAGAASNFTTSAGALTLDGAGGLNLAGNGSEIDITSAGATLDINVATVDVSTDLVVGGDLTVNGSTTVLDTVNLQVEDSIVVLGSGSASNTDADKGLIFTRSSADKAVFWDETESEFAFVETTSTGGDTVIAVSSYSDLRVKDMSARSLTMTVVNGANAADQSYLESITSATANVATSTANGGTMFYLSAAYSGADSACLATYQKKGFYFIEENAAGTAANIYSSPFITE